MAMWHVSDATLQAIEEQAAEYKRELPATGNDKHLPGVIAQLAGMVEVLAAAVRQMKAERT